MEETKRCPYCGEEILAVAKKCKHCGEWLEPKETPKVKKPCPICGELVDEGLRICPHCKEPMNEEKDNETTTNPTMLESIGYKKDSIKTKQNHPYKNYIQFAFGAVILGSIISFANDFANEYTSEVGGLVGQFIGFGRAVPSWIGAALDGIGTFFLLWNVADSIRSHNKGEGQEGNAKCFFLKALSILYIAGGIFGIFAEGKILSIIGIVLSVLTVILMAINAFILKNETDPVLDKMGEVFIVCIILAFFFIKSVNNPKYYLFLSFFSYVVWGYAMYLAHNYLLKKK